jgi:hypothetical protein
MRTLSLAMPAVAFKVKHVKRENSSRRKLMATKKKAAKKKKH